MRHGTSECHVQTVHASRGTSCFEGHLEPFFFLRATRLVAVFAISLACASAADVIESHHAQHDFAPTADPDSREWKNVKGVTATKDFLGKPVPGFDTQIRSRWTDRCLYLLYISPYRELNLKPNPSTTTETDHLWDWDVAEAFIGTDFNHIGRYKEFEVSPQGEWVDLDIDFDHPKQQIGEAWNSGFQVKARVDAEKKIWYAEMKIPMSQIDSRTPRVGLEMRVGLYRIAGANPNRIFMAWQPNMHKSFHVPSAFGILRLAK